MSAIKVKINNKEIIAKPWCEFSGKIENENPRKSKELNQKIHEKDSYFRIHSAKKKFDLLIKRTARFRTFIIVSIYWR